MLKAIALASQAIGIDSDDRFFAVNFTWENIEPAQKEDINGRCRIACRDTLERYRPLQCFATPGVHVRCIIGAYLEAWSGATYVYCIPYRMDLGITFS